MRKELWREAVLLFQQEPAIVNSDWRASWNLGWCHFKLDRLAEARRNLLRANRLAPDNPTCLWALGNVYLRRKQFKRAEAILLESLRLKESHLTRIALALAYSSQGKLTEAEAMYVENIKLKPESSERYESYAAFLSDVGREYDAQKITEKAASLRRIN
jgi:Flp pilus assembly protein TadD